MIKVSLAHGLRHSPAGLLVAALAIGGLAPGVSAQGTQTAAGRGVVLDSQDAAVPNATITVRSDALQQPIVTTSDAEGRYVARPLPRGTYTILVERTNFTPVVVEVV